MMKKKYWGFILALGGMLAGCAAVIAPAANSLGGSNASTCSGSGSLGGLNYMTEWSTSDGLWGNLKVSGSALDWSPGVASQTFTIRVGNEPVREVFVTQGSQFNVYFKVVSKAEHLCVNEACSFTSLCSL